MLIYMSTVDAPDFVVSIFNPSFFASDTTTGLTQAQATALFLTKSTPDTATALTTFGGGLATNSVATTTFASSQSIGSSSNTGSLGIDTTGDIRIAPTQTTATIEIGGASTRTGAITIGSAGTTNVLPITIGSTAATSTTTIRNPIMSLSYTTYPSFVAGQVGFTYAQFTATDTTVTAGGGTINFSVLSLPNGIYSCSWQFRIYNSLSTGTSSITSLTGYIVASNSAVISSVTYPTIYGGSYQSQTIPITNTLTQVLSGSSIIPVTFTGTSINMVCNITFTTTTGVTAFRGAVGGIPQCYCIATRIA